MGWAVVCFLLGWLLRGWFSRAPDLLVRRHRDYVRACWRRICGRKGGRARIGVELRSLIHRMSLENPLWGAPRIHGELKWLGIRVAQSTVSKYMVRRRGRPTQGWKTFLHNHKDAIAAIDMLVVTTRDLQQLYAFVVLALGRRTLLHIEVTDHPTAFWLAQQITEAFPWDSAPGFIIRDNDGAYGQVFRRRLWAMGIRDKPTMPHSPWQNGYAERVIGSIRREPVLRSPQGEGGCLDHVIIRDADHLRHVLREYVEYYNSDRTHLGLAKDSPYGRAITPGGTLVSSPVLGGLHHRYVRNPSR